MLTRRLRRSVLGGTSPRPSGRSGASLLSPVDPYDAILGSTKGASLCRSVVGAMPMNPVPYREDARTTLVALILAALVIVLLVGLYAFQAKDGLAVFAGGSIVAAGAGALGVLLGLLFGVPHAGDKPTIDSSKWRLIPNTSLDQISDWLTKILVGVGLTQLFGLTSKLQALAEYLGPVFGGTGSSAGFALAVVLSSSADGFMLGFVWTKLILSPDLAEAGEGTYNDKAVTAKVDQLLQAAKASQKTVSPAQEKEARKVATDLAKKVFKGDDNLASQLGIETGPLDDQDLEAVARRALDDAGIK